MIPMSSALTTFTDQTGKLLAGLLSSLPQNYPVLALFSNEHLLSIFPLLPSRAPWLRAMVLGVSELYLPREREREREREEEATTAPYLSLFPI
jgi:hypothetical protein